MYVCMQCRSFPSCIFFPPPLAQIQSFILLLSKVPASNRPVPPAYLHTTQHDQYTPHPRSPMARPRIVGRKKMTNVPIGEPNPLPQRSPIYASPSQAASLFLSLSVETPVFVLRMSRPLPLFSSALQSPSFSSSVPDRRIEPDLAARLDTAWLTVRPMHRAGS